MKALVKERPEPGLWMADVAPPRPGADDVLIRVRKSAVCGTDMHIWDWDRWAAKTIPVPMTVGHEYVGEVAEVGANVTRVAPGDRVTSEGHIVCGACRNCRAGREHLCRETLGVGVHRPGSFAEYVCVPEHNVYPIPPHLSDDVAAILDPYGNAVHTALSFDLVGEDVLITGAGPIGLMAVAICRRVGARHVVVTDQNPHRLSLAEQLGASRTVNVRSQSLERAAEDLGLQEGFDVGLEMSGAAPALRQMIGAMTHGGKIAMLGIPAGETAIDWTEVVFKGLVIKGIYGREMFETWYKGIALLQSGLDIAPVITHRFAIGDFAQAFATMSSGDCGKIILDWEAGL
jgi:threonine 3-dehydrogenase